MPEIPVLEAAPAEVPGKSSSKSKWLIVTLSLLALLGGSGAGAWFYFSHHPADDTAAAEGRQKGKVKEEPLPKGPPLFVALDPPFVTNFEEHQVVRFLQITAQVMSRDPDTIELVKANDPIIRNDLLILFSNQRYEDIASREGKEHLREQALEAVRNVVKAAGGKPNHVEAVYFTSFVMQ